MNGARKRVADDVVLDHHSSPMKLRMLAAVKLFELRELSSGAAARLAGVSRIDFLTQLAKYAVPVFDLTEEDFKQEARLG